MFKDRRGASIIVEGCGPCVEGCRGCVKAVWRVVGDYRGCACFPSTVGPDLAVTCAPLWRQVTPALLKFFTDMAYNAQWAVKSGSELPEACACHFSTVAAPDRWPEMEAAYLTLVKDEQV